MILTDKQINACFEGKTHQSDVIIDLYKILHPDWDEIKKFNGWPTCSKHLSQKIGKKFIEFDQIHHKNAQAGGLWMNNGWSSLGCEDYKDMEARPCKDVEYTIKDGSCVEAMI